MAIREMTFLRKLRHVNVLALIEIVVSISKDGSGVPDACFLVCEYAPYDLTGLLDHPSVRLRPVHVKSYMRQILEGVQYCHKECVLHRDMKSSNILVSKDHVVKIGDWGMARYVDKDKPKQLTNNVITSWYRPPELLLGERVYDGSVDMWSVGMVFAELLLNRRDGQKAICPGASDMHQLKLIWQLLGTPTEESWPRHTLLPGWRTLAPAVALPSTLRERVRSVPAEGLQLLERLLTLDPKQRITAAKACDADYFWVDPMPPVNPADLPKFPIASVHEIDEKRRKQRARPGASAGKQAPRPGGGPSAAKGPGGGRV
jgi:serine/threonine protein kinase